jgi:hypothetical protein
VKVLTWALLPWNRLIRIGIEMYRPLLLDSLERTGRLEQFHAGIVAGRRRIRGPGRAPRRRVRQAVPFQVVGAIDVLQQLQPLLGRPLRLVAQQFLQVIESDTNVPDPLCEPVVILQRDDCRADRSSICAHSRCKIDACGSGQATRSMLLRACARSWKESPTVVQSRSASCRDSASCALNISSRRPNSSITPRIVASLRAVSCEATCIIGRHDAAPRVNAPCRPNTAKAFDSAADSPRNSTLTPCLERIAESEQQLDARRIDAHDPADVDRHRQGAREHSTRSRRTSSMF